MTTNPTFYGASIVLPFGYLPPMTLHCALGFCSKIGPCESNAYCGCECHMEDTDDN